MVLASLNRDRALAVIAHASFWACPVVLPLVLYYAFRNRRPWVGAHASEAFNFQLSAAVIIAALFAVAALGSGVGAVAILAILGLWLWATISAISRLAAAADDTLKPYSGPVFRLLSRPSLRRSTAVSVPFFDIRPRS